MSKKQNPLANVIQLRKQMNNEAPEDVPSAAPEPAKPGRPRGKRSDPAFEQITAYIRKDTHRQVKLALLQAGEDQEFSELVEDLLTQWLKEQKR